MKIISRIAMSLLLLAFDISFPATGRAYMTLFNDDGNWMGATLTDPEEDKTTYRACKNSKDRNQDESSKGSLAVICITVSYADNSGRLGLWLSEAIAKPGEEISCAFRLDDGEEISRNCKIVRSRFGPGQIVISDDKAEIKKIVTSRKLAVRLGIKNLVREPLEFDMDREGLRKVEKDLYEFF